MRQLVALCAVLVLLSGCGQPDPETDDLITAFHDAGLRAYPTLDQTVYNSVQQLGLVRSQGFTLNQATVAKHVIAAYDTVDHAEAARAANSNNFTSGYRRGKLVLVWWH